MPQQKLQEVLENVVTLTSEKDSRALELALAQTLFTLADVKNVVIHSASNINRNKYTQTASEKPLPDEVIQGEILGALGKCLESASIAYTKQEGKELTLFPLLCAKKQPLAVVVVEAPQDERDYDLTIMILKIYHNFIALMNENERDTLTGLLNRKTFDLKINSIISNLQNNQQRRRRKGDGDNPSYLAIFDIDHFNLSEATTDSHFSNLWEIIISNFLSESVEHDLDIFIRWTLEYAYKFFTTEPE